MKKFFTLLFILCASLFCTACINNLAIQELNQNGKQYLEKGDYDAAIARFQSSVDLDENSFESRYNLGVAYINKKDYEKAIKELKIATTLNPDSTDALFSYAVALEGEGLKIEDFNADEEAESEEIKLAPTEEDVLKSVNLVNSAIMCYEQYASMIDSPEEKKSTTAHIEELKEALARIKGTNATVNIPSEEN